MRSSRYSKCVVAAKLIVFKVSIADAFHPPDAPGVPPHPEPAEGEHHQAGRGKGRVGRFDGVSFGAQEPVCYGAVMDLFNQVVPAFLDAYNLAGRQVNLQFGVVISEKNLGATLARAYIQPFNVVFQVQAVVCEGYCYFLKAVQAYPLACLGARPLLGGRGQVGLFFPAQQNPCKPNDEHKKEQRNGGPFVQAAINPGMAGYFFGLFQRLFFGCLPPHVYQQYRHIRRRHPADAAGLADGTGLHTGQFFPGLF